LPALPPPIVSKGSEASSAAESSTLENGSNGKDSGASSRSLFSPEVSSHIREAVSDVEAASSDALVAPSTFFTDLEASSDRASASPSTSSHTTAATAHASQLQALNTAQAMQDASQPASRELRAPVGTPAWTQELGDQLTFLAQRGQEAASLRLSPEHLGPLEVRISMNDGQATVWFGAANADTRSALDQSLSRLREMFASQGMVLADAGVFKEAPRHQHKAPLSAGTRVAETHEPVQTTQASTSRLRLIDTYV
jgi:flagellar hook-length control protein FliK